MKALLIALWAILSLSACATELPKEVRIPVPVPCLGPDDIPAQEKLHSDDEILAMEPYDRTIAVWDDRKALGEIVARQDVLLQKCKR